MLLPYYTISSILKLSTSFFVSCNCVIYDCDIGDHSVTTVTFLSCFVTCVTITHYITLLFFLNQQFITWDTRADHGNYFITTYIKMQTT